MNLHRKNTQKVQFKCICSHNNAENAQITNNTLENVHKLGAKNIHMKSSTKLKKLKLRNGCLFVYIEDEIFVVGKKSEASSEMESPSEEKNTDGYPNRPHRRHDREPHHRWSRHSRERKEMSKQYQMIK